MRDSSQVWRADDSSAFPATIATNSWSERIDVLVPTPDACEVPILFSHRGLGKGVRPPGFEPRTKGL